VQILLSDISNTRGRGKTAPILSDLTDGCGTKPIATALCERRREEGKEKREEAVAQSQYRRLGQP